MIWTSPATIGRRACCSANLLQKCFLVAKFGKQWLMHEEQNVFSKVVGCIASLEFVLRFTWIDALEDAKLSKVLEWYL